MLAIGLLSTACSPSSVDPAAAGQTLRARGYDIAVTESCHQLEECAAYAAEYPVVLDIEHTDEPGQDGFAHACGDPDRPSAMILRDHRLVTPDDAEYVYRGCE